MNIEPSERLNTPISATELERRWAAVRSAMEAAGVDVLLMQSSSERVGGYVRWFTDMPTANYPTAVLFPRDDAMTVVRHGPLDGDVEIPPEGDGYWRGVKRVLSNAAFPPANYTREYDARLMAEALAPYRRATMGLIGTSQMSYALGGYLEHAMPHAQFIEVSDLVDGIKAIKSDEEKALIRASARLQDEVIAVAFDAVEPGKKESDITAVARRAAHELGSEAGIFLSCSGPIGAPSPLGQRHRQNRVLRGGDVFALLVEVDGPGGMYTEIGRTCTLGPAPTQVVDELEFALTAQRFTLDLLRPGAHCKDIWAAYNEFMREHGRPEERRIHCHAQGYDLVERPFVRCDETMTVEQDMNFACHPTYVQNGFMSWICDNYLIDADGPGERLHTFPQRIVER